MTQAPRTRIAYNGRSVDTMPLRVAVCMVHSRSGRWPVDAMNSVRAQSYANTELVVLDNTDHSLSIGAAYNQLVRFTTAPLVLFLSDDDLLSLDLVASMVACMQLDRDNGAPLEHCTTNCTLLIEQNGSAAQAPVMHLGMFRRAFLERNPFDEALPKGVHTDMLGRIARQQDLARVQLTAVISHHYGYIFRQHVGQASGMVVQPRNAMHAVR